ALTESESGAGKADPDWGTAASKSWFTAVFPWLGSGLAMARIADLRQHPSKKLPLVEQQNFAVGCTIRQFTVSPDPDGATEGL
ncbi:hypothetical protein, partial [Acinetobacter sp. AR2-3]|uniref:hypothetical protein n=1 Tax=Acinetobacter sp. AR2-3 TaxID=1891969 RepID=UPI001BB46851